MLIEHKEIILRFIAYCVNNKIFKKSKSDFNSIVSMLPNFELSIYFTDISKDNSNIKKFGRK